MLPPQLTIILAEDDDGHATLIRRGLERAKIGANILRVRNAVSQIPPLPRSAYVSA